MTSKEVAQAIYEAHDGADCEFCGALCPDDASALIDAIDEALMKEREACAKVVNDARFDSTTDLRELVARIKGRDYFNVSN